MISLDVRPSTLPAANLQGREVLNNCGANLTLLECKRCGTKSPQGTRFCGEWGNKL